MLTRAMVTGLVLSVGALLSGCGNGNSACDVSIGVDPATAQADHAAVLPGNQARFLATNIASGSGCPKIVTKPGDVNASWTTSDTVNTTIAPVKTAIGTDGIATCVNATATAATITATSPEGMKATATLTCN